MTNKTHFLTADHWQRIGIRHHHGICLPLSSLHTKNSCGIGEYLDLIPLLEWLHTTGFDIVQLLPITDSGNDSSPYMGVSAHALHPIYLSLQALPGISSLPELQTRLKTLSTPVLSQKISYHEILNEKIQIISTYLNHFSHEIESSAEYQRFVDENQSWLVPYSIFKTLKEAYRNAAWWDWNPSLLSPEAAVQYADTHLTDHVMRWRAIQYLCYQQMRAVRAAADTHNIRIVGDVPILINKDSVDVWWHPQLFYSQSVVGAPPDMYNKEGQYWGFPRYNWHSHKKDLFSWWKNRLHVQESFFHLFRLDHLVGFYRLWTIPPGKKANQGHFVPKTAPEWLSLGEGILSSLISSTTMLPLGEDLGDVPDIVRDSMQALGIPGLKVLRWERKWKTDGTFINPKEFSPESVSTLSTHDSSTVSGWWEESPEDSKQLAHDYKIPWNETLSSSQLYALLQICHSSGSLFHINPLNEYLSVFSDLSWNDPTLERINTPGTVSSMNWTYRCKQCLETITSHKKLSTAMKQLTL